MTKNAEMRCSLFIIAQLHLNRGMFLFENASGIFILYACVPQGNHVIFFNPEAFLIVEMRTENHTTCPSIEMVISFTGIFFRDRSSAWFTMYVTPLQQGTSM